MRQLERLFDGYGQIVARHPVPFIILPILITLISLVGITNFHSQDDIWDLYSPLNSLSRFEELALERFEYASSAHHYRIQVLVNRKDEGNLMNEKNLDEIAAMHSYVANNISVYSDQSVYTYENLCGVYCNDSDAIVLAFMQAILSTKGESTSLVFTFPIASAFERRIFLGYSIGHLIKSHEKITGFKLFILHFMINQQIPNAEQIATDFERQLFDAFDAANFVSRTLKFSALSRNFELQEQRKIAIIALPHLAITALILGLFMILSLSDYPLEKSQHMEALVGLLSPVMALVTSSGLLWGFGVPFSNILTVVPFLVVTIGVDDTFLILAGWRHSRSNENCEARMGDALAKSGSSVTVTSVTDVLCFSVGLFSNLPVVRLFCLFASLALAINYLYQMTIFTAFVSIFGKYKLKLKRQRVYKAAMEIPRIQCSPYKVETKFCEFLDGFFKNDTLKSKAAIRKLSLIPTSLKKLSVTSEMFGRGHIHEFALFLHHSTTKITVFLVFIVHIVISSILLRKVNTDFSMENLYLKESPLNSVSKRMQEFVLNEAFVVNFAMYPMPNFAESLIREKFNSLIEELETIPKYAIGPKATNLWTREFQDVAEFWGEDTDVWKQDELLNNFKEYKMEEKFLTTSKRDDEIEIVTGFFWTITYHNMNNFLDVQDFMTKRRAVIERYSKFFNVSSHHPLEKVPTEAAASALSNFVQTSASAVILMTLLVILFAMDIGAVISVFLSIISISLGTVSYLQIWGVGLDGISLISMLMSIGFSVDYSAHICYHFFSHNDHRKIVRKPSKPISIIVGTDITNETISSGSASTTFKDETYDKVHNTLLLVGWPVIQSASSTVLGIIPLIFIRAYIVAVFWKTVILVNALGLFHALFFLPVMFLISSDIKRYFKSR